MVPTMGALHMGHIALVKKAISENDITVVSIFVNPTQFNNSEDLNKYPNSLKKDAKLLRVISDEIILFAPSVSEIYPDTITSKSYNFDGLDMVMEGRLRKGHFDGVGTIVELLLTLVRPTRAYFGEKDFQQLQIVKKLVEIKKIPVEIIGCPIVREPSGLAMSSRNERLSTSQRKKAAHIYKILLGAKEIFDKNSPQYVIDWVQQKFESHHELELEYIEIRDIYSLQPVIEKQKNKKYRAFIAIYIEDIRLIDNIALN